MIASAMSATAEVRGVSAWIQRGVVVFTESLETIPTDHHCAWSTRSDHNVDFVQDNLNQVELDLPRVETVWSAAALACIGTHECATHTLCVARC